MDKKEIALAIVGNALGFAFCGFGAWLYARDLIAVIKSR